MEPTTPPEVADGRRVPPAHEVSVVIPVYRGADTIGDLVTELAQLQSHAVSPGGAVYRVTEVLLVHDHGPDDSGAVMSTLAAEHPFVQCIWLARNYGQHPATVAGIASSGSPWIVTMDEDGQHVPNDIGVLLDTALSERSHLVYGVHASAAPHARWRNWASRSAKRTARLVAGTPVVEFTSFRLIDGERARSVAAYCGPRTFLDVALSWSTTKVTHCTVSTRPEGRAGSGYTLARLLSHFWTLVLSSGTRPLRIVSAVGVAVSVTGLLGAVAIIVRRIAGGIDAPGWASVVVILLVLNGLLLFAIGVIAEYVGALLSAAQGRPLYIIVSGDERRPGDHE